VIIGQPPIAKCVERFFRAHPDARSLIDARPPGPTKSEAVSVGNAMVNREIGGAGVLERTRQAPFDRPRRVERTA
jgi:hypothetical protein